MRNWVSINFGFYVMWFQEFEYSSLFWETRLYFVLDSYHMVFESLLLIFVVALVIEVDTWDNLLISCRSDVAVAVLWALVFGILVVSSYVSLYLKHFWLSFFVICLGILLPIRLKISRHTMAKKRERRLILPLSMWTFCESKIVGCPMTHHWFRGSCNDSMKDWVLVLVIKEFCPALVEKMV